MPRTAPTEQQVADVDNRFTYHAPTPEQIPLYAQLRKEAHLLALQILYSVPEGRERALALTHLEMAVMWGNAGIARHSPKPSQEG